MDSEIASAVLPTERTAPFRRFCFVWFGCVVVILLLVGIFDSVMDPYDVIGTPRVSRLNSVKPYANRHEELTKTYQIERVRPRTVLLGTSRVDIGLDPASRLWPKSYGPVFNYGVDGADLRTIYANLRQAAAAGRLERAILVVDFELFWFPTAPHTVPDEAGRRFLVSAGGAPNPYRLKQRVQDIFFATLSRSAFEDSIDTLRLQYSGLPSDVTPLGFATDADFRRAVRQDGYYDLFAQKAPLVMARAKHAADFLSQWHGDLPQMDVLREMIAFCQSRNIELTLLIPPYDTALLDLFRKAGLGSQFEVWRNELLAAIPSGAVPPVTLWDFSSESIYTSEPIPPPGDRGAVSHWFWEYDHFKAALGAKMVQRILHIGSPEFGTEIIPDQGKPEPG